MCPTASPAPINAKATECPCSGEADAWVQAILGIGWTEHVYWTGTLSGVAGRVITVYYRLFLDAGSNPRDRPETFKDKELRH